MAEKQDCAWGLGNPGFSGHVTDDVPLVTRCLLSPKGRGGLLLICYAQNRECVSLQGDRAVTQSSDPQVLFYCHMYLPAKSYREVRNLGICSYSIEKFNLVSVVYFHKWGHRGTDRAQRWMIKSEMPGRRDWHHKHLLILDGFIWSWLSSVWRNSCLQNHFLP